jgi:hypothetical protein
MGRPGLIHNIIVTWTETAPKGSQGLAGQTTSFPQMRTITCNDETAPWSRSHHLLRTSLLPSRDASDNNFSKAQENRTELVINQGTL